MKAILDTEGIEKAVLVGQSAGGFVAQSFIARYPSMVRGLFTIGTCPYGTEYYSRSHTLAGSRFSKRIPANPPSGL